MQWNPILRYGSGCVTNNGTHIFEDSGDSLWCRMCGWCIDDKIEINKIHQELRSIKEKLNGNSL